MSKEIYISSTPHETRLAIVENDALTEIYYERENEYTLAGSIYNGKVTRVLPGMQSSFVDIGLERDAFLYITDFMEEAPDSAEFDTASLGDGGARPLRLEASAEGQESAAGQQIEGQRGGGSGGFANGAGSNGGDARRREGSGGGRGDRNGRSRRGRGDRGDRSGTPDRQGGAGSSSEGASSLERPGQSGFRGVDPEFSGDADVQERDVEFRATRTEAGAGAVDSGYPTEPVDVSELGEGAPGADGSRRWRGRRGRRRGRGPVTATGTGAGTGREEAGPDAGRGGNAPTIFPAEEEAGTPEDFGQAGYGEQEVYRETGAEAGLAEPRLGGAGEQVSAATEGSYNDARRGGGNGERGGRGGRDDRGGRDRGRGGRDDRGGRGERNDRAPRVPRGFEPSRSLYGVDSGADLPEAPAEPIILPGESLSKYRAGGEIVASQQPVGGNVIVPKASTEYAIPTGWDGGATLPGESLSRHRRPEAPGGRGESGRSDRYPERKAEQRSELRTGLVVAAAAGPAVTGIDQAPHVVEHPVTHVDVLHEERGVSVEAVQEQRVADAIADRPETVVGAEVVSAGEVLQDDAVPETVPEVQARMASEPAEYEPVEASASYRVDPAAPSEYRQSAAVAEPVDEQAEEIAPVEPAFGRTHTFTPEPVAPAASTAQEPVAPVGHAPEPSYQEPVAQYEPVTGTPLPEHDITTLSAAGEMVSELPAIEPAAAMPPPQEVVEPTSPIRHETAIQEAESQGVGAHSSGVQGVVAPADGAADLADEHAEEFEEQEEPASQSFAPGSGELEEELLDEDEDGDEYEAVGLHASYADEKDDAEEETLEGAADLGTMLREMSIDQITRPAPEGEEEDEFEEDFLEEDFVGESGDIDPHAHEFEEAEEGSEEYARTAEATGDFSTEFREPEVREQGDGANGDGATHDDAAGNERRGGRRDVRRGGGRDRDARRGSDSSGRPRNMGGSGDRERGRSGGGGGGRGRMSMQSTNLPAISELLKPGQEILVQIAKEPIAKKGARITSHIALPGRFLVFMPTVNHTGVSRKIESDGERRRLKEILLSEKGEASGGFIVRTAASGASEEELRSDLRFPAEPMDGYQAEVRVVEEPGADLPRPESGGADSARPGDGHVFGDLGGYRD